MSCQFSITVRRMVISPFRDSHDTEQQLIQHSSSDFGLNNGFDPLKICENPPRIVLSRLGLFLSMTTYLSDIATDLRLAHDYYKQSNPFYCAMTLTFTIIPFLFTLVINFIHYHTWIKKKSGGQRQLYKIFFVLLLPVSRY